MMTSILEEENGDENEGIEVNRLQPVICSTASDVSIIIFVNRCYPIRNNRILSFIFIFHPVNLSHVT